VARFVFVEETQNKTVFWKESLLSGLEGKLTRGQKHASICCFISEFDADTYSFYPEKHVCQESQVCGWRCKDALLLPEDARREVPRQAIIPLRIHPRNPQRAPGH